MQQVTGKKINILPLNYHFNLNTRWRCLIISHVLFLMSVSSFIVLSVNPTCLHYGHLIFVILFK